MLRLSIMPALFASTFGIIFIFYPFISVSSVCDMKLWLFDFANIDRIVILSCSSILRRFLLLVVKSERSDTGISFSSISMGNRES